MSFQKIILSPEYINLNKILYIGSRINVKTDFLQLGESGSLFDENFINQLKDLNISIVVCCLEYKFFKRSAKELRRAYHMMKQQLFLADRIQFLTKPDLDDFNVTMDIFKFNPSQPLGLIPSFNDLGKNWLTKLEEKCSDRKKMEAQLSAIIKLEINIVDWLQKTASTTPHTDNINPEEALNSIRINYNKIVSLFPDIKQNKIVNNVHSELGEMKKFLQKAKIKQRGDIDSFKKDEAKLEENLKDRDDLNKYKFEGLTFDKCEIQKNKGVFISGIYTVEPLSEQEIFEFTKNQGISPQPFLELLASRPCNILHFGIIRGGKGIDEAVELGLLFKKNKDPHKIVIAGKLMLDLGMVRNLLLRVLNMDSKCFQDELEKAVSKITRKDVPRGAGKDFKLMESLITQSGKHDEFNNFCISFYHDLAKKCKDEIQNFEIYFNVAEDELRQLAMSCRYAIKFDNKGMANNASTMASCLGFYLPVISTQGLVTNEEFINDELSSRNNNNNFYPGVVILPKEEYYVCEETGELKPRNPTIDSVYHFIKNDTPERYLERLINLKKLHTAKMFDCDTKAQQLLDIFLRLVDERKRLENSAIMNEKEETSSENELSSIEQMTF